MKSILIKIVAAVAAVVLVGVWLLMPSPIHRAANNGNIEAVKKHLADGVDVDAKSWELFAGFTPLYLAAGEGHKEIAELLIAAGAEVNAKDEDGLTPLHYPVAKGHKDIVELLIGKGADVNAKVVSGPNQGSTPLDAANETNHPKTADLLRKHGGKTREELKASGK
jgi:ankyrin repeat protein